MLYSKFLDLFVSFVRLVERNLSMNCQHSHRHMIFFEKARNFLKYIYILEILESPEKTNLFELRDLLRIEDLLEGKDFK